MHDPNHIKTKTNQNNDTNITTEVRKQRNHKPKLSRAEYVARINPLPDDALLSSDEAAAFLNKTKGTLANWRARKIGPPFIGRGRMIWYQKKTLKAFVAEHEPQEK